jgi:tetratricopeptide (TPR) repeat protein
VDETKEKEQSLASVVAAMKKNRVEQAEQICHDYLKDQPGCIDHLRMLGHSLTRQGRHSDAEESLRFAISLSPDFAPLHEDLGGVLAVQGSLDDAIGTLEAAIRLDPQRPTAHKKLGQVLAAAGRGPEADEAFEAFFEKDPARGKVAIGLDHIKAGRVDDAIKTLRDILRENPDNVDAMRFLAMAYQRKKTNQSDAEALLRRALQIAPDFAAVSLSLGTMLTKLSKHVDAIAVYEAALQKNDDIAGLWAGLGGACALAGYPDRASMAYGNSIALDPNSPGAHMSHAHALKTLGDQEGSLKAYRTAIKLKPEYGEVYWSMANLKVFQFEPQEVENMEKQLESDELTDDAEAHFRFALGKAYEDRKEYDKAWHYYDSGNKKQRTLVDHDPVGREQHSNRILEVFDDALIRKFEGQGHAAPDPIFIVSLPRSGSTLVEQILASHSQVEGTAELSDLGYIANSIGRYRRDQIHFPKAVLDLSARDWKSYGKEYLENTRRHRSTDKPFFTDKMPNNFPLLGFAALALPNAKLINARRHPLDSCLGSYKQLFGKGQDFTYDMLELGMYYEQYDAIIKHWHKLMPGKILDVHYEETVTDLEGQVRRILDHCGLPFEEQCVRFHETERAVKTASSEQVRQPIYQGGMGKWRKYEAHLGEWQERLASIIDELPEVVRNAGK